MDRGRTRHEPAGLDLRRGGISPGVELLRAISPSDASSSDAPAPKPSQAWRSLHIKGSKHGFLTGREMAERDASAPLWRHSQVQAAEGAGVAHGVRGASLVVRQVATVGNVRRGP